MRPVGGGLVFARCLAAAQTGPGKGARLDRPSSLDAGCRSGGVRLRIFRGPAWQRPLSRDELVLLTKILLAVSSAVSGRRGQGLGRRGAARRARGARGVACLHPRGGRRYLAVLGRQAPARGRGGLVLDVGSPRGTWAVVAGLGRPLVFPADAASSRFPKRRSVRAQGSFWSGPPVLGGFAGRGDGPSAGRAGWRLPPGPGFGARRPRGGRDRGSPAPDFTAAAWVTSRRRRASTGRECSCRGAGVPPLSCDARSARRFRHPSFAGVACA